jgi:hypothetical protein
VNCNEINDEGGKGIAERTMTTVYVEAGNIRGDRALC